MCEVLIFLMLNDYSNGLCIKKCLERIVGLFWEDYGIFCLFIYICKYINLKNIYEYVEINRIFKYIKFCRVYKYL